MHTFCIAGWPCVGCSDEPPRNPLIELLLWIAKTLNQRGEP